MTKAQILDLIMQVATSTATPEHKAAAIAALQALPTID